MSAPRLAAESLIWRNRRERITRNEALAACLVLVGVLAAFIIGRQALADSLRSMRSHAPLCAGLAAFFSVVSVAQRRTLKRAQFPRSWLAAVPVKPSIARWEAFLIETRPAGAALAMLSILAVPAAVMALVQGLGFKPILIVWACLSGGIALGVALSFLIPQPKPVISPPGSRYVPKARAKRTAPVRASLSALGHWPIRQMFAWAQPKVVARATIPVLVMMPLGTMADTAMIVIALFGILFAMALLVTAVISVSRAARRWLAPLPVRDAAVIRAILIPAWGVIAAAGAVGGLLLLLLRHTP
jgi:hypothetical protein